MLKFERYTYAGFPYWNPPLFLCETDDEKVKELLKDYPIISIDYGEDGFIVGFPEENIMDVAREEPVFYA